MRRDLEGAAQRGQLGHSDEVQGREGHTEAGRQGPRHREMACEFRQRSKAAYP